MKKRKLVSLLLATALAAGALFGCSSGGNTNNASKMGQSSQTVQSSAKSNKDNSAVLGTPLADVRVRQALAYAIDMETIVDSIFEGKAEVAKSFTAPGEWLNADIPVYKILKKTKKYYRKKTGLQIIPWMLCIIMMISRL